MLKILIIDDELKQVTYVNGIDSLNIPSYEKTLRKEKGIVVGNTLHPSIDKVLRHIHKHYCESITINDLSDQFHLNTSYLSALFKKEIGINISKYILELRMNKAKSLLEDTDTPISEIALRVGFHNAAYFAEQFRKCFSCTPTQMRKNVSC